VRILGVYIENIRSYRQSLIVFPPRGVTVVHGEVGSGKTSLLMAIEFALLGLPGGAGKSLFDAYKEPRRADLLRANTSMGRVRLLIKLGSRLYVIERRIMRVSGVEYEGVVGRIEEYEVVDGKPRPLDVRNFTSRTMMDDYVIDLLGLKEKKTERSKTTTPLVYTTAIYVPQFNVHEVLSLDKEDRVEIIERALGLDKYKVFRSNYEKVVKAIEDKIEVINDRVKNRLDLVKEKNRDALLRQLESIKQEIVKLQRDRLELEKENEKIKQLYDSVLSEARGIERQIVELKARREKYEEKKKKLNELEGRVGAIAESMGYSTRSIEELRETLMSNIKKLEEDKRRIEEKIQSLEQEETRIEDNIASLNRKVQSLIGELNRVKEGISNREEKIRELENSKQEVENLIRMGICPVCKQKVTHEHGLRLVEDINDQMEKVKVELENLRSKQRELEELLSSMEDEVRKLEESRNKLRIEKQLILRERDNIVESIHSNSSILGRLDELIKEVQSLRREIAGINLDELERLEGELNGKLRELNEHLNELSKVGESLRQRIQSIVGEIARREEMIKGIERQLQEIDKLLKEVEKLQEEKKSLEEIKEFVEIAGGVVGEIESTVLKILVDEFRRYFYDYLSKLLHGQPIEVVVTDDFGLKTKIKIGRQSYDISSPSGGQNIAISLAYRLALNRVVREYSPTLKKSVLILDEPTTGFSSDIVSRLKDLMREIGGIEGQAIVVTHDKELIEAGDCRIKLNLNQAEHKTEVEVEECAVTPEYRDLVERILLYGIQKPSQ
jgi:exonuclease SbcC